MVVEVVEGFQDVHHLLLGEAQSLPYGQKEFESYPRCGVFSEAQAPVIHSALKQFGIERGLLLKYVQVNHTLKGEGVGWHNDLQQGTDTALILYMTRDEFEDAIGGYLEVGVRKDAHVSVVCRVYPSAGRGVLFDNTDPNIVHRLEPMKESRERFSLLALFARA